MASFREQEYVDYATMNDKRYTLAKAAFRERVNHFRYRLLPWLPLRSDALLLDIACGCGESLVAIRELGFANVHGCDISEEQIRRSKEHLPPDCLTHGPFQTFLRAEDRLYDCIIASHVLEHLDHDALLEGMALVRSRLVPGGRFIVLVPNAASPVGLIYAFGDLTHRIYFSGMSLAQAGVMAGYEVEYLGGVKPEPRGWRGRFRAGLWWVIEPFIRLLCGDSIMRYGRIAEPELIAVFSNPK